MRNEGWKEGRIKRRKVGLEERWKEGKESSIGRRGESIAEGRKEGSKESSRTKKNEKK